MHDFSKRAALMVLHYHLNAVANLSLTSQHPYFNLFFFLYIMSVPPVSLFSLISFFPSSFITRGNPGNAVKRFSPESFFAKNIRGVSSPYSSGFLPLGKISRQTKSYTTGRGIKKRKNKRERNSPREKHAYYSRYSKSRYIIL